MKNAYFRLPVNLTDSVEIDIYETPVNLVLNILFFSFIISAFIWSMILCLT